MHVALPLIFDFHCADVLYKCKIIFLMGVLYHENLTIYGTHLFNCVIVLAQGIPQILGQCLNIIAIYVLDKTTMSANPLSAYI